MIYPVRKVFITQGWGENPNSYSQFGYKGHNGIDLRIFDDNGNKASEGKLLAPHDGIVKEAAYDPSYGWYYKIENKKEGSILAHNKQLFLKVGDSVDEGQVIAITDSTGNSTGPHVHWGYYRFPRDKQNGYGGTINQVPLLEENMSDTPLQACEKDREKFWKERDALYSALNVGEQVKALEEIERLQTIEVDFKNHKCPEPIVSSEGPIDNLILNGRSIVYEENGKTYTDNYMVDRSNNQ
jgi:murein DD-endopeptidase MepM/ murein hydrolase activator NlpD